MWKPAMAAILISFGTKGGAGQLPLPIFSVVGPWVASTIKGKDLMVAKWQAGFYDRPYKPAA